MPALDSYPLQPSLSSQISVPMALRRRPVVYAAKQVEIRTGVMVTV